MNNIKGYHDEINCCRVNCNSNYCEVIPGAYHFFDFKKHNPKDKLKQSMNVDEMEKLWKYCCKKLNIKELNEFLNS